MILTRLLAPVLAVGLLAVAADASAGTLTMRDEAQVFSASDTAQLRGIVAQAPFDARLVTTNNYPDQAGFSRFVGTLVSEPNMVVVGLDPQHHHVQVHFGVGSHIAEANWPAIERAGNDAFKRSAWEEGGADIFRAATSAVGTGASAPVTSSPQTESGGSFLVVGLIVMLIVGIVLAAILFAVFRRRSPGYGSVGYGGGAPYPGGGYPGGGPYYGPGGTRGAMGPLGGGLIGAGLGGVAGYELGKMEGEREQRGFDQGGYDPGGGGSSAPDNGSFDAGGGGSSFDDSGSSGGGGSDFGGGGGDSGGGGGDSGGGGSDF